MTIQRQLLPLLIVPFVLLSRERAAQAQTQNPLLPPLLLAQTNTDASRQVQAEALIQAFAAEDYEQVRQLIDPRLQALWSADKLAEIWQELIQQSGPVERVVASGITAGPISTAAPVCVEFANSGANCSDPQNIFVVTFSPDGNIVGVNFPKFQTISEIAEQFARQLGDGDFAAARGDFSSEFKAERFPDQLESEWSGLEQRWGEFQGLGRVRENESEGLALNDASIVEVEMAFARETVTMLVLFDDSRRIVQYLFPD
ncbi:MAG: DUF3887 domain-containing protein [Spirulinaceae cyanobacterium SM2_1_0]|nr:DUF3887 domain-containing protein [Spirulinaceae cyanobacterium SM2_1_0]